MRKLTDYKFWFIERDDSGYITKAAIRFYEGVITTEIERSFDGTEKEITRYRRLKKLIKDDLVHLKKPSYKFIKDAVLYTYDDFGFISTDDELRSFLNKELAKDKERDAINEQIFQN